MDRLAAFYHWKDRQGLDQALMVARRQPVDLEDVERWSVAEGKVVEFAEFLRELEALSQPKS
jgi:hypothetical protein